MFPALLESVGTSELLLVLGGALVLVGPRKLPGLAASLGNAMRQVRAATDGLKNVWEAETEALKTETGRPASRRADVEASNRIRRTRAQAVASSGAEEHSSEEDSVGVEDV